MAHSNIAGICSAWLFPITCSYLFGSKKSGVLDTPHRALESVTKLEQKTERGRNGSSGHEDDAANDAEEARDDLLLHQHVSGNQNTDEADNVVQAVAHQLGHENIVDGVHDVGCLRSREGKGGTSNEAEDGGEQSGLLREQFTHGLFLPLSVCDG